MSYKQPIKLIKCLYNSSSYTIPLRISDKCFNAYAERYGVEFEYIGKVYSIDTKLIALVEELGLEKCSGYGTFLLCQLVPEELKDYIDSLFEIVEPVLDWKSYVRRFGGSSSKIKEKESKDKESE